MLVALQTCGQSDASSYSIECCGIGIDRPLDQPTELRDEHAPTHDLCALPAGREGGGLQCVGHIGSVTTSGTRATEFSASLPPLTVFDSVATEKRRPETAFTPHRRNHIRSRTSSVTPSVAALRSSRLAIRDEGRNPPVRSW